MARLKVSVIGLRGHAGQHIELLRRNPSILLDKVFYYRSALPEYGYLPITSSLSDCFSSNVIIVSTPTSTHLDYMKALSDFGGYILLEKPAVNTKSHIQELCGLPAGLKSRIRVNFNFRFHPFAALLSDQMQSGILGEVFSFDVYTSHGVAFRKNWANTWRVENQSGLGPLETTGIHYVQFSLRQFGACTGCDVYTRCLSGRPSAVDTGVVNMSMANGTWVRIRHSYAAPYAVRFEVWGTEGYLVYDGEVANLYYPRDTFDGDGRYITPPVKSSWQLPFQQAWSESLHRAQRDFLDVAREERLLDPLEFDRDVSAMGVLLDGYRRN